MQQEFKLKKYNNIDKIILASWQHEDKSFTMTDLKKSTIGGLDQNENEIEFSYEQQKEGILKQGYWGWIDENKTIHYWISDKNLSFEELIHFFAHEIGHRTGKSDKNHFKEEMRAEEYGNVATLAYKFAKLIKSNHNETTAKR